MLLVNEYRPGKIWNKKIKKSVGYSPFFIIFVGHSHQTLAVDGCLGHTVGKIIFQKSRQMDILFIIVLFII